MNARILKQFEDKYNILSDLSEKYKEKMIQTKMELRETASTLKEDVTYWSTEECKNKLKRINEDKKLLETELQDLKRDLKLLNHIGKGLAGVNQNEIKKNLFTGQTKYDQEIITHFTNIGISVQKIQQEINLICKK